MFDRSTAARARVRLGLLLAFAVALFLLPLVAAAQDTTGPSSDAATGSAGQPSAAEIDRLIQVLEDPVERRKLVEYLRTLERVEDLRRSEAKGDLGAVALDAASRHLERISDGFIALANALSGLPKVATWLLDRAQDPMARDLWLEIALRIAAVLLVAGVTRWVVQRIVRAPQRSLAPGAHERVLVAIPMQIGRLLLALLPPAAVVAVTYATLSVLQTRAETRLVVLAILHAYLIVAAVTATARELIAPDSVFVRATHLTGETAEYLIAWVRRLAVVTVYGYLGAQIALLLGLPADAFQVLLRLLGLIIAGLLVVLILQNRHEVATGIRGIENGAGRIRGRIADIWHVLAIVYVVAFYFVWAVAVEGGFEFLLRATMLTIAIVAGAQALLFALGRLARKAFSLSPDSKTRYPGLEARANRYFPAGRRLIKGIVFVAVAFAILEVWGFGTLTWLATDAGSTLINTVAIILLVVLMALALSEMFGLMVERYLRGLDEKHVSGTRARTLLPLLRTAFRVVLIVMVVLVVLSQVGVDIAPLLAGAGVVGLAIGFGAQKLVQDVITGFFILVEDSISVGDVVEAGGHSGVVESMTIRSIEMRDADGVVHTVPFSSVSTVKNYSKDFAYALVDIGVGYHENTDDVIEVIREVGEAMRRDSPVKDAITSPLEIFGVNALAESAVMIQARFRTRPTQQWAVKREFLRRIKLAFDEKGIEIPFRQQTVYFGHGDAPALRVRVEQATPADGEGAPGSPATEAGTPKPPRD
jgi:small conductance mechanosensitive channel